MKVNEIEINGKIYRANYIKDSNESCICNYCDLNSHCANTGEDDIIFELCRKNPFNSYFKEVKQKETITNKFYRFSSGTVFNINHIKHIIDMGYVELCTMDHSKYEFSILLTNAVAIHVRFDTKAIATRERNKFIKFIEKYGYANNSI